MARGDALPAATTSGIWAVDGGRIVCVERFATGAAVVLCPSESVLTLLVELPLPTRAARAAALPFAVEDRIAARLDDVHVALGREVAPRTYLAGVVDRATMAGWVGLAADAGLGDAALVPDALLLPSPPPGAWSVERQGARVRVLTDAGTGFAAPADQFEALWTAGGQPPCRQFGDVLPFAPPAPLLATDADVPLGVRLARPSLDLRQGEFARERRPVPPVLRRLGLVLAVGALAHGAIAAADTLALRRLADQRRTEAATLVQTVLPGTPTEGDFAASVAALLPSPGGGAHGRFLPLLTRASKALMGTPGLTVQSLGFDAGGSLTMNLEAGDLAGLQRAQAALTTAGLRAETGPATSENGRATEAITVTDTSL